MRIKDIEIKNPIVLAPMAGISNAAYIRIATKMHVGLAFTELISTEAIIRNNQKTFQMLNGIEDVSIPVGIQLFGRNPEAFKVAAQIITKKYPNAFIDINMGCPVLKVAVKAKAGSHLLKEPELVKEIIETVKRAVNTPVTVKIRSGWDNNTINAVEIARIAEKAGADAITVHGRTRAMGYSGKASLDIIKKVKEAVSIPVIGNGDVTSKEDFINMLSYTKCDAVMIGRKALGNPWIFDECYRKLNNLEEKDYSISEKIDLIKEHLAYLVKYKSEKVAMLEARTQLLYYLKYFPNSKSLKEKVMHIKSYDELLRLLDNYLIDKTG